MISIVENKLYEYCNELNIPIQELSILLSFSGGIDSTVLATLLVKLRDKFGFELTLIHFNHNAHDQANQMERFCQTFARKYNVNYYNKIFSFIKKANFEACARVKRYSELDILANNLSVSVVFTAHHLDDQIETLYMKMLDKSDWISRIGIRDSIGKIKRPLLDLRKEVIRNTATDLRLTWIEDPTNDDISIRRNNVRKFLIPKVLKSSPIIIKHLLATSHAHKLKMEIIISNFNKNKKLFIKNETNEYISIIKNKIKNFEIEYLKIFLYWCNSYHFKIKIPQLSRQFWLEFSNYIKYSRTGSIFKIGSLTSIVNRDELLLISSYSNLLPAPDKIKLTPNRKWYNSHFNVMDNHSIVNSANKKKFSIPKDLFINGIYMRRWKKGDRILSATSKNTILISNLYINNKLSILGKLIHPIIVDKKDRILWVPGMAHAELQKKLIKQKIKVIEWVQT